MSTFRRFLTLVILLSSAAAVSLASESAAPELVVPEADLVTAFAYEDGSGEATEDNEADDEAEAEINQEADSLEGNGSSYASEADAEAEENGSGYAREIHADFDENGSGYAEELLSEPFQVRSVTMKQLIH